VKASLPRLLRDAKARGEKLAMVALYDAPSAVLACEAGVDMILVGDSMGNTILGHDDTLSVTMEDVLRHTAAVARGVKASSRPGVPVVADMPFGSYADLRLATENAAELVRVGARAVKLEGAGVGTVAAIGAVTEMGVPVVGHLGFTPQSSLSLEGVVQGKSAEAAASLLRDAKELEKAGCCAVVLEAVPREVARRVTEELSIFTIGIGAGPHCDGQVLVWHDLVGLAPDPPFRFVKRYADAHAVLKEATEAFVGEVRSGTFPEAEHGWEMDEVARKRWESRDGVAPRRRR
jgi:3-methyl-2-oxobutanoate hydroxymethyltransferase